MDADVLARGGAERIGVGIAQHLAGGDRHLLAHQDPCLLVVQGHDRGRGQQVGAGIALDRVDDHPEQRIAAAATEPGQPTIEPKQRLQCGAAGQVQGAVGGVASGAALALAGDARGQRQDAGTGAGVLGSHERHVAAFPAGDQQLHAQLARGVVGDLHHDRLHQHLFAAGVELGDDVGEQALGFRVGIDDQRVGAGVAHDHRALAAGRADHLGVGGTGIERRARFQRTAGLRPRRLPDQFLQHRQQLFGIGVLQLDHAHVAAALGAPVQLQHRLHHALDQGRITTHDHRIAAFHRQHRQHRTAAFGAARAEQAVDRGRHFAGRTVAQGHRVDTGPVLVDLGDQAAQAPQVVGVIGHQQAVALRGGQDHAAAADQRAQGLGRDACIDVAQGEHLCGKAQRRTAVGTGLLGRSVVGNHAVGAGTGGNGHQSVGAQHRQQYAQHLRLGHGPVTRDRDRSLHPRVDDEGGAGGAGDVLDERAQVGFLQVHSGGLLGHRQGNRRQDQGKAQQHG